jgi:hypothetical protein
VQKWITSGLLAIAAAVFVTGSAISAGSGETIGDGISDGLMGNEPNIIPFESGDLGPSQVEPGSIGDLDGASGHENSVEGSGAPGPITCDGNWVGVAQIVSVFTPGVGNPDATAPGNPDAPGMNVDCGTGGSPPHSP